MFTEFSLQYVGWFYAENSQSKKKADFSWVFTERVTYILNSHLYTFRTVTIQVTTYTSVCVCVFWCRHSWNYLQAFMCRAHFPSRQPHTGSWQNKQLFLSPLLLKSFQSFLIISLYNRWPSINTVLMFYHREGTQNHMNPYVDCFRGHHMAQTYKQPQIQKCYILFNTKIYRTIGVRYMLIREAYLNERS